MSVPDGLPGLFFALSDPQRRRVLARVAQNPGATVTAICDGFAVSRFAVMRHLNVLEEAGLITRRSEGRERRVSLGPRDMGGELAAWAAALRAGKDPD
jgi:DNA-binding transcriptional ArsR family regulator